MKHNSLNNIDNQSQHEKDIQWLFWQSESAMGIKSNFDVFIQACKYSTNHQDEHDAKAFAEMLKSSTETIDILIATKRERRIMKNYHALNIKHQQVFEAYYEARQYPGALKSFGPGAGLIPFTETGKHLTRLMMVDPTSVDATNVKDILPKLRKEVDYLYREALNVYSYIAKDSNE